MLCLHLQSQQTLSPMSYNPKRSVLPNNGQESNDHIWKSDYDPKRAFIFYMILGVAGVAALVIAAVTSKPY